MTKFYKDLQTVKAVPRYGRPDGELISPNTIREIHKLLRNAFNQAVKWELMARNPAQNATVPKAEKHERNIWDAQTLMKALSFCDYPFLSLAINLAFACSLRMGELLGLTWDGRDYDLVFASTQGTTTESNFINRAFNKLITDNNLPKVVFHSLRHTSTTYKLKLSGGDIKAVQSDTGHAQATMVTERHAHILDDDRRLNATRFQNAFYEGASTEETTVASEAPQGQQAPVSDPLQNLDAVAKQQLLFKLLSESPDMAALLTALAGKGA